MVALSVVVVVRQWACVQHYRVTFGAPHVTIHAFVGRIDDQFHPEPRANGCQIADPVLSFAEVLSAAVLVRLFDSHQVAAVLPGVDDGQRPVVPILNAERRHICGKAFLSRGNFDGKYSRADLHCVFRHQVAEIRLVEIAHRHAISGVSYNFPGLVPDQVCVVAVFVPACDADQARLPGKGSAFEVTIPHESPAVGGRIERDNPETAGVCGSAALHVAAKATRLWSGKPDCRASL